MFNKRMQILGEERSAIRELFEYGNRRKMEIGAENVFDFSLGNPNIPAPAAVNGAIARLVRETPAETLHGYSSAQGLYEARAAIAAYIRKKFGAPAEPNLIYMTCGAAASLTVTLTALCEEGDEFIVLAPFFPEYRIFVESAGGKLVAVKTNSAFHPDLAALENAITPHTKAVIVNSPNNPTGAVYTEEEMRALAALLEKKSGEYGKPVFLLSDEPYRELSYKGEPPYLPALYKNTVVCYSWSKSLSLAGERIGYIFIPPTCENAQTLFDCVCGAGRSLGFVCAPVLFQRVAAACAGQTSDIAEYRKNRDLLYGALTSYGYECTPPEGAFYLFVKSPEESAAAFCERAKNYELLLVPSESFGVAGYVRISYCVARSVIQRSLPAFRALIEEYRK